MGTFKHGFVPIVSSLGLPIVPAFIQGGFEVFSRHSIFPRRGKVSVRFGAALELREATGSGQRITSAAVKEFTARLEQAVRALSKKPVNDGSPAHGGPGKDRDD
jgi:1-acyl-sn-glycerol-3-phosphate acyltransferase